jgi:hypothetical protein
MALSATFTANFASFYDAVDKADAKLKDFGAGADKVGGRLTALGNSFSGVKIVQDATLMVKAVEDIGGASKLTEKELARLGATTNEAVAKMKALGMDIPKNLQDIADQTKGANQATNDWMGTLTKIAGAMGIAFSIGMVKDFIGSVFDAAGAVKDLSEQWGVSTKFVQQWGAAAAQSGVESEQLGKTIQYMTEKLSESSPEYEAMIKNIGLSSEALRKMSAEDAYKEIIQKIAGIKDETLQLDVAMGILGPSAKKIIGGIRDGMYEAADAQKYMSDETIKRLEAAGDAWARLKNNVIIYTGEMLASVETGMSKITSSWGNFFTYTKILITQGDVAAAMWATQAAKADDAAASLDNLQQKMPLVSAHGATMTTGLKTTAEVLAEVKAKEDALKKSQADRAAALAKAKADEEAYTKAVIAHLEAVDDLSRTLSGDDLIGKANTYLDALKRSIPIEKMTAEQQANINKVMLDAIEVYHAAGTVAPDAMYDTWRATQVLDDSVGDMTTHVQLLGDMLKNFPAFKLPTLPSITLKKPIDEAAEFKKSIEDLSGAFAQLGQISGGAFGEVATEIGVVVGAMNLAQKSTDTWTKGLAQLKAGNLTQGLATTATGAIGVAAAFQSATQGTSKLQSTLNGAAIGFSVAGPWGAAVGAGVGLLKGFINAHNAANKAAEETKNLRQSFIAAAGGLHELTLEAKAAGTNLDDLVRARSADQVQAAIKGIQDAMKFQADAMQLAIDTAEKYGFTLEELGPAMQRQELDKQAQQLFKDWEVLNSAGIDTVAITQRMSEAVSKYVQDAAKMGTEIPEAMRPMLEAMVKSGTLLDANGNAITDLEDAGISFSLSMSDGFKALIDEVHKLTEAIERGLGDAIDNVPDLKVKGSIEYEYNPDAGFRPHWQPAGSFASGTDGFKNFGAGTPVMLHGWEAVVPRDDAGAFATVSAPGGAPAAVAATSIVINAQGAFFDTPGDLQRLADRVNDALTAKHGLRNAMRAG